MRTWSAGWLLLLLAGCARLPPSPAPAPDPQTLAWETRRTRLLAHDAFLLSGRIAVQRAQEGGQATVRWHQRGEAFELRLVAPLGQGSYQLSGDAAAAALVAPSGDTYRAPDLDSLMTTHLNWTLPVAGARYWVRGIPIPDHPTTQLTLDAAGRLTDFAQDGWRISVLEYRAVGGLDLPRRLFLLGRDLKIRFLITDWTLPAP